MRLTKGSLCVVAALCGALVLGMRAVDGAGGVPLASGSVIAQTAEAREAIVGTYELVGRRVKSEDGQWQPVPDFGSVGYITYGETGHMGVHVMPTNRVPFTGNGPTAEEAREALDGYTAYFGPFSMHSDDDGNYVIHHRLGQINPTGDPDAKRYYDIDGDQLVLTPAASDGSKARATRQVIWQRLPDVPLSDEAQRFVGFRGLLHTDRYTERDGEVVSHGRRNDSRAGSYIIYTPTGHMMVHLTPFEDRARYAGARPTPEEALAAYRSYAGYFGRFTVHEEAEPPYVLHHLEGRPRPGDPSDAFRLYQLEGDVLRLGARPRVEEGQATGGHLYWELLPTLPE